MDLDQKTKKAGDVAFCYEVKAMMGDRAKHERFYEFFAPTAAERQEDQGIVEERRVKIVRTVKIAGLVLLAAVVVGLVIWQAIENPQYFSIIPEK